MTCFGNASLRTKIVRQKDSDMHHIYVMKIRYDGEDRSLD